MPTAVILSSANSNSTPPKRRSGCSRCPWRISCAESALAATAPEARDTFSSLKPATAGNSAGSSAGRRNSLRCPRTIGRAAIGLEPQLRVGAFSQNGAKATDRQDRGAGRLSLHSQRRACELRLPDRSPRAWRPTRSLRISRSAESPSGYAQARRRRRFETRPATSRDRKQLS